MIVKIGTVCSGVDAPVFALTKLGINFEHMYSCEMDDACVSLIGQKYKPHEIHRDMWDLAEREDIPYCDILIAGLPCQAFSNIGKKLGLQDERGILFRALTKIMEKSKPKYVIFENVRNILTHDNGKTFNIISAAFAEVGYTFKYKLMKTSDYGLPQGRVRVYAVCHRIGDKDGEDYMFPAPIGLKVTLDEILGGKAERKIAFTVRVGGRSMPIGDRRNWDGYIVDGEEMRLKQNHVAMLQGFPADFYEGTGVCKTQALKQMGNTMTVPVVGMVMANLLFDGKKLMEVAR